MPLAHILVTSSECSGNDDLFLEDPVIFLPELATEVPALRFVCTRSVSAEDPTELEEDSLSFTVVDFRFATFFVLCFVRTICSAVSRVSE